ncbi:MAG: hypothetical protein ABI595_15725 [Actinomycetota bacterium]
MQHGDEREPVMVMVEDSPDARLFIELSSLASDLTEADHALELAVRSSDVGSTLADARPYLVGYAVVAYCRTILHSNVRRPLEDHIQIPQEFLATHDTIKAFRNATIAHSQSDLAVTYPIGVLAPDTLEVKHVSAATVVNTLPWLVVRQFRELLAALGDSLDEAITPVRQRLENQLRAADRRRMAKSGIKPQSLDKLAEEFEPRSKRSAYPTGHTFYWDRTDESL